MKPFWNIRLPWNKNKSSSSEEAAPKDFQMAWDHIIKSQQTTILGTEGLPSGVLRFEAFKHEDIIWVKPACACWDCGNRVVGCFVLVMPERKITGSVFSCQEHSSYIHNLLLSSYH